MNTKMPLGHFNSPQTGIEQSWGISSMCSCACCVFATSSKRQVSRVDATLLISSERNLLSYHIYKAKNDKATMDHTDTGFVGLERSLMVNAKTLDR
jgi:hypothetical protein